MASSGELTDISKEIEQNAVRIQKIVRGRQGRRKESLLKKRAAIQRSHDSANDVDIRGVSRGRRGRNSVANARSQELAAIRIQSIHRGKSGREKVAKKKGNLTLSTSMIRKGLKCHGLHPIILKHAYLQLELPDLGVRTVDALHQYPHIMYLNISKNVISDLSILSQLPTLVDLQARNNFIEACLDFCPPKCSHTSAWSTGHMSIGSILINADLSCNSITEIGDLTRHPNLETLLLRSNRISLIAGLSNLQFLQVLDLSNNSIGHITGLDSLPLRELNLSGNMLYTLHGLENIPTLSVLDVSQNCITCLAPLRNSINLTYLDVQKNNISVIRQVEFLSHMLWLRTLVMMENTAANKPHYRYCVIRILPNLSCLDRTTISTEERIRSANLFEDSGGDSDHRKAVFQKLFPEERFKNFSPVYVDIEADIDLTVIEEADSELDRERRSRSAVIDEMGERVEETEATEDKDKLLDNDAHAPEKEEEQPEKTLEEPPADTGVCAGEPPDNAEVSCQ